AARAGVSITHAGDAASTEAMRACFPGPRNHRVSWSFVSSGTATVARMTELSWTINAMMHVARRSLLAGGMLIVGLIGAEQVAAQSISERREAAVLQARAGRLDAAIAQLRAMLAAGEDDGLVAMDLATLLAQA